MPLYNLQCLIACEMQELELVSRQFNCSDQERMLMSYIANLFQIDEHGAFVEEEVNNFIKDAVPNEEATHLIAKFKECTLKFGIGSFI